MYVFNKSRRLYKAPEFQTLFKKGARFKSASLIVYAYPNIMSNSRLGVIVPKKVLKLAVHRHHMKRIVRENFRLNQYHFQSNDIVVFINRPPTNSALIRSELDIIWEKIKQWHRNRD